MEKLHVMMILTMIITKKRPLNNDNIDVNDNYDQRNGNELNDINHNDGKINDIKSKKKLRIRISLKDVKNILNNDNIGNIHCVNNNDDDINNKTHANNNNNDNTINFETCPMVIMHKIMNYVMHMCVKDHNNIKTNISIMNKVRDNLDGMHRLFNFFRGQNCANVLGIILHNSSNLKQIGKPCEVECSLHAQCWGKTVSLRKHTSWVGVSLGSYSEQYVIVFWSRDSKNSFEVVLHSSLIFVDSNSQRTKKISYKPYL